MTLCVESPTVYTSQGVPISVTGIAQVKIQGQNEDMLLVSLVFLHFILSLSLSFIDNKIILSPNKFIAILDCLRTIFGQIRI
jgi:small basic protein